jgi:hypothetical protein
MDLRYAGACQTCGEGIPAGGRAFYDPSDRTVTHPKVECAEPVGLTKQEWSGSPVSGSWITVLAERRMGGAKGPHAPSGDPFARTRSRGYYGPGAGRCEDAPACGCC